jgi:DNA polymerase-3 subunit gamma/tau
VNQVNALRLQGVSAAATLEDMAMLLQRMAVMQMVPSMAQDGDDPDTQGLADLAQAMPAEETQLLYSLCLHGRTELGLAPDEYAALTMVLLRLLAFKPQTGSAEKKSPLTSPRATTEPQRPAAPAGAFKPTAPAAPAVPAPPMTAVAPVVAPRPTALAPSVPLAADLQPKPAPEAASPIEVMQPIAEPIAAPMAEPHVSAPHVDSVISPVQDEPTLSEPPPWEDWPDTTDYADVQVIRMNVDHAPVQELRQAAPALRVLPVREAPSGRADVPSQASPPAVQATPEGDVWLEVVQGLMAQDAITALVRELALQSQLLARETDHWQLRVERETLNHSASRERLQLALQAAGHGDVKLGIEIGPVTDSPARRLAVKAAEKMVAAQALIQNDPLVQAMVRDFGAKIVPGSIQII